MTITTLYSFVYNPSHDDCLSDGWTRIVSRAGTRDPVSVVRTERKSKPNRSSTLKILTVMNGRGFYRDDDGGAATRFSDRVV